MGPTYGSYLCLDELLGCQRPATAEHDEMLFVVIHQVYELWFKQILHETDLLQRRLEDGNGAGALHTARRIAKILKTIVGQLDVLETMTPEAVRLLPSRTRDGQRLPVQPVPRHRGAAGTARFHRADRGSRSCARRSRTRPCTTRCSPTWAGQTLVDVYAEEAEPAEVCEALVDIDEGIQEWRYRHVMMVQRIIGTKMGTGGSAGADYLRSTLFRPAFPDLWEVRGV